MEFSQKFIKLAVDDGDVDDIIIIIIVWHWLATFCGRVNAHLPQRRHFFDFARRAKAQMRRLPCKWVAAIFNWPIHLHTHTHIDTHRHCFNLSDNLLNLQQREIVVAGYILMAVTVLYRVTFCWHFVHSRVTFLSAFLSPRSLQVNKTLSRASTDCRAEGETEGRR